MACDFFISVTASLRILYVFVAMEVGSRRILHCNVREHPTAEWTIQQFREFLAFDHGYRFAALKGFGVRGLRTPRTVAKGKFVLRTVARNNPPRVRGSCHPGQQEVRGPFAARAHSSLGPGIPEPPQAEVPASVDRHKLPVGFRVGSTPVLCGLHHEYSLKKEAA